MAENEGRYSAPETQFRENFSAEWNKADTPEKKKSLLQRILKMIRDMAANAQTATQEAKKEQSAAIPQNAKDAKLAAAQPVIEFLQFLTGTDGQPLDAETLRSLQLSETQQTFLKTLAKTTHTADTATFIAQIIDRAIQDEGYLTVSKPGEGKTQLEKDFETAKLNDVAAESMRDSLKKLAQEGKLKDSEGITLTEEDVEQRFSSQRRREEQNEQSTQQTNGENIQNRLQDATRMRTESMGRRGRRRQENPELIRQYRMWMERLKANTDPQRIEIVEKLTANQQEFSSINKDSKISADARRQQLNELEDKQTGYQTELTQFNSELNAILDYLTTGEVGPPFTEQENPEESIREAAKARLGITNDAELENAKRIFEEGTGLLDGTYEGYQDLAERINSLFTAEILGSKLIINGKLDLNAVQQLQAELEDEIGVLFETLYNSPKANFNDAFSSYSEGQMLRKIIQHLRLEFNEVLQNQVQDPNMRKQMKEVLTDMIISPIQRRPSLEQIVHQYQQVGATIDLEKLKDILKTYNITTLQEFYNDDLTKIISDLLPSFIQKKFVQNGNKMINDLFQLVQVDNPLDENAVVPLDRNPRSKRFVVKYRDECIDYMYRVINSMYKAKGLPEVSKERINARFSRAYLDNFLLSLRGIKVMSKALPMHHEFGDLPFMSLITGVFNPLQGWGKFGLRGRGHQESGDAETTEFSGMNNFAFNEIAAHEYIKKYGDVFDNFHPAQMKKEGDKRIMFEVFPDNKQLMEELRTGKWDAFYTMLEVYKGMVFGNVIDQSGWTFDGFNATTLNNLSKTYMGGREFGNLSRQEQLELKYKTSGVITAFWDAGKYAGEDTMNRFVRYMYGEKMAFQGAIEKATQEKGGPLTEEERQKAEREEVSRVQKMMKNDMDWAKTTGEYTKGDKRFDKIFDVTLGDKKTKVAFREYKMYRETAIMGQIFHQLLLKDPNAWLGEMVQSYPQLRQGYVTYTDNNGNEQTVRGAEFYFNVDKYPDSKISKDDKVRRDRFRYEILPKFRGKAENDYLTNVPHLQKIMNFYADLVQKHLEEDNDYQELDDKQKLAKLANDDNLNQAIDRLDIQLSIAHQKAVDEHEPAVKEGYIEDDMVKGLMFGGDGLITHFNNMVNSRENYFGDGDQDLGEENSFYQRWAFSREQTGTRYLPEGDTNMKYLFEDVRNTQALDRRLNTDMAFAKAQEVLGKVPSVCKKASDADNFDAWYGAIEELHSEMSVIADEDQGQEQKYQQLLYQTVCNWFSLDSDTEKMFIGALNQMRLGTDVSMATLKSKNMSKFILDQDSRREYLIRLQDKSYLKGNYDMIGGWGFDTAELIAGVNMAEIFRKQAIYAIIGAIAVTIATAVKEGYEEEVDED